MADVFVKRHDDGTWWATSEPPGAVRDGQIFDGWEGIAAFVEAGHIVHWDSPDETQRFTDELGDPSEI